MESYKGQCHCGDVKLEMTGPPKGVCYCHCSICGRSTGGPFVLVGIWSPENVKIGDRSKLTARKTSDMLERYRCSSCGATIYNAIRSPRMQLDNVMLPLLDAQDDSLKPSHHIYYADRVMDVPDDLHKFDGFGIPGK